MKDLQFSWKYALAIVGVGLLAYVVMGFNSRMAELRRLQAQLDGVSGQATGVALQNDTLRTQIVAATSDQVVRAWAYQQGHMKLPGDQVVAPLAPGNVTPIATPTPALRQMSVENWQMWALLFVDSISP